jgi:catechol 2,3-dioxygenase-like lactoylglutathione lyase family enzyme
VTVKLSHTIVRVSDKHASARFYADILGLRAPSTYGPFVVVDVDNEECGPPYWDDPDRHILEIITVPYGG